MRRALVALPRACARAASSVPAPDAPDAFLRGLLVAHKQWAAAPAGARLSKTFTFKDARAADTFAARAADLVSARAADAPTLLRIERGAATTAAVAVENAELAYDVDGIAAEIMLASPGWS
jgi:hypothetical protein